MGLWIYEVTYLYQKCFNLEHCQTLQCFSMFFPWGFATKTREQHGCVSKYGDPPSNHILVLQEMNAIWVPHVETNAPNKSYHIIPHLFPLLWFWLWKHISKIQSQKRYKKHIQSWTKTLPDLLPGLGGGPRNFQRQGSRQFEIRCIYRGGWNSTQLYKDYNST